MRNLPDTIAAIFSPMFEPWMTDDEKVLFVEECCEAAGVTIRKLEEQIAVGVKNGYPVEKQIALCRAIFT